MARMRLIQNCWYVDAHNIAFTLATPLFPRRRVTLLQVIAVIVVLWGVWGAARGTVRELAAICYLVAVALILVADRRINRRGNQ